MGEKFDSIRWLELHFTDLAGYLHSVTIPAREVKKEKELFFSALDGSSVEGFTGIEESDLQLRPDLSTLSRLPWRKGVARAIADVYRNRKRFEKDPRYVASRAEEHLKERGWKACIGPEVEFQVINKLYLNIETPQRGIGYVVESVEYPDKEISSGFQRLKKAYHTPTPIDMLADFRNELSEILEDYFGFKVEAHHHEVAAIGQVEIDFTYGGIKDTADRVITLKYVARNIARRHGLLATFMPKLVANDNGNGMHVHVSIWDTSTDKNLFHDPADEYAGLSQFARYFIGGILDHAHALAAIVAPTVNSYRRLVPGYEAPVYLVWSKANRSAIIRVPFYEKPNEKSTRIEFRSPDPSTNPYLAFAAIIAAGLDGVNRKIEPGDPLDVNAYSLSPEERRRLGIKELPRSLDEALDALESDNEFLKPIFPKEMIETYLEVKRKEAAMLRQYPNPVEVYTYFNL